MNGSNGRKRSQRGAEGNVSKKARKVYSADFETITKAPTRVWAWGVLDISDPDSNHMEYGTELETFIDKCSEENSLMLFFNLGFDGMFILSWLLTNGYMHVQKDQNETLYKGQFTTLISHTGKFYTMKVRWRNGNITEFRDAAKKFPAMSVASLARAFQMDVQKGDIDYHKDRPVGHDLDDDEVDYLDRDVRIVAKAVKTAMDNGMTRLTVGSDALSEYKKTLGGDSAFRTLFPVLAEDMDAEIRRAYRGGFTYLSPMFKGPQGCGIVLDVNSLYPSVMYNDLIPYGMPQWQDGKVTPTDKRPLTIFSVTFTAKIKKDHVPCIQIKGSSIFGATEYLEVIEEPVTLMVTNVDWDLYLEQYDIDVYAYGGGWAFKAARGLFKDYIDKWSKIKAESTGGQREIAKLFLNSLYGKFASNPNVTGKIPVLEDGVVKLVMGEPETKDPIYTAAGVFITSHARALTIRAAQKNYHRFAYADTDSLHLLGDDWIVDEVNGKPTLVNPPEDIDVHPTKLGAWKFEYRFEESHFVRPKVYLEKLQRENVHKTDCEPDCQYRHNYKTAFAGLPQGTAMTIGFEDLVDGKVFHGKLSPRKVEGGVVLEDIPFTLNMK